MAKHGVFERIFGPRPESEESVTPARAEGERDPSATSASLGPPGEGLAVVVPSDHVSLRLLRAHVRKWDWMSRSQDALRLTTGEMSLFDYTLAQRQRNARHRLIERADRGEVITEDDLIEVMGADFNLSGPEIAMILDVDRDARRARERQDDRSHWTQAISDQGRPARDGGSQTSSGARSSRRGGQPESSTTESEAGTVPDARLRVDDSMSLIFAAESAISDSAASLTDWLNDDPSGLVRSLRADTTLAHPEARGEVLYEATVCAWARTVVAAGMVIDADLPAAVRRWLADDIALRAAEGDQDALNAYFTDGARESEALHRAAWIDAVSESDGRASAVALRKVPGVTAAAKVGGPSMKPGEFKRLDTQDAVSALHRSIRRLRRPAPGTGEEFPLVDRRAPQRLPRENSSIEPAAPETGVGPAFDQPPNDDAEWDADTDEAGFDASAGDVDGFELPTMWSPEGSAFAPEVEAEPEPDAIWNEPAPRPAAPLPDERAPVRGARRTGPTPNAADDLAGLPQSSDDAPGPAVWVRGRRVDGEFAQVRDDMVTVRIGAEERTISGPLDRENGPAVVEPDGTARYYRRGALSREGGPAIEAPDPSYDVYAVNGAVKPLDLPPALMANREFRGRLFRAWERAGFPPNAELQARALLAVMMPAERAPILDGLRASTDPHDQRFARATDILSGATGAISSAGQSESDAQGAGSTAVQPIPPQPSYPPVLGASGDDDYEAFYESLTSPDDVEPSL